MSKKPRASDDLLGELHLTLAKELLKRVQSGEATPAELNAAIKFLQNNKIEAQIEVGDDYHKLYQALPEFDDEEEYVN